MINLLKQQLVFVLKVSLYLLVKRNKLALKTWVYKRLRSKIPFSFFLTLLASNSVSGASGSNSSIILSSSKLTSVSSSFVNWPLISSLIFFNPKKIARKREIKKRKLFYLHFDNQLLL